MSIAPGIHDSFMIDVVVISRLNRKWGNCVKPLFVPALLDDFVGARIGGVRLVARRMQL